MTGSAHPSWVPQVEKGYKVLVTGASGGIGQAVVRMLQASEGCIIGAQRDTSPCTQQTANEACRILDLQSHLETADDCETLVKDFIEQAGGIDGLVVLSGSMEGKTHWQDLPAESWEKDIQANLSVPFYLARAAMRSMKGGSVILTGTESALHGGSPTSFPYGVAKRGTECLVQGLAREGAKRLTTVNGIRMGYIASGTHERWQGKTQEDMDRRAGMVPMKRGGTPDEAAALILYLLSGWARFITGQMLPLTGGDWL